MNVKKFTAQTSREALRKVREALGPDAVILSNRATDGGVEILALASEDISSLASPSMEHDMRPEPEVHAMQALPSMQAFSTRQQGSHQGSEAAVSASFAQRQQAQQMHPHISEQAANMAESLEMARLSNAMSGAMGSAKAAGGSEMQDVMNEIRAMRGMMETQLAELAWNATQKREPQKGLVMREMLAAGFSASLSRYLTEKLPPVKDEAEGMRWLKTVLGRNLSTMNNENEILEKGGVFALVGPTGVGKTTSTAKLAARCVMRHGTDKLALITTDGYRIGGHEQLRIYGKILGVMVHSVKDEADLRIALRELRGKHTVLIDTVGASQRDQMVAEQVAMLSGAGVNVQRLLCLNATSTGETLSEVVRAYQGGGLSGCIMTKLDEAVTIGNVLDVIIRSKLNLYYVSNGQRVPEDLHLGDRAYLIDRAFKAKRDSTPYQFQDAELPLIMANAGSANHDRSLREVNLG
jgi:flagellar biosynthesis protein FlhF